MIPEVAHSTIVKYYSFLRGVISEHGSGIMMGGDIEGMSNIVEIDESVFGKKQKYHRGAPTKKHWVFGITERNSNKTHFQCVDKRDKATLIPILKKHVSVGSTVYHDDWGAYRHLDDEGFLHGTVVHSKEFVSKEGVCTNTIEGKNDLFHCRVMAFKIII